MQIDRRRFLKGVSATGALIRIGLPPLAVMMNFNGTAYGAETNKKGTPIEKRFVIWFNGNGIPERYWIPETTGMGFDLSPCLAPMLPVRDYVHVISGVDNVAARLNGQGNGHFTAMCGLMTGTAYTGRGASGPSIDQILAGKIGTKSRFHSLQIGVAQESHGENVHRNMSWAGYDRALPPEMIPQNLFDRLFGVKDQTWINREKSILDLVQQDVAELKPSLGADDKARLDEHLQSIRDLERAVASLPPDYGKKQKEPEDVTDLTDYPKIAKIQSDLLVQAFATGQTRVASYMLTKCQSLTRFPWLGLSGNRHHDYTHNNAGSPEQQRILRDITRWHAEEFSYFLQRLRAVPEGDGNLLDHTACVYVHEHAEANPHKCNGLAMMVAGGGIKGNIHTKSHNSVGDVYLTVAEEILKTPLGKDFPTAAEMVPELV
ncbi:MAG TPA: DUF1552 domain-containing protein [Bryobacteraceae bacterium]|nr:DUF1552 domain-containing protein [Bryobacteraceae bacterium]